MHGIFYVGIGSRCVGVRGRKYRRVVVGLHVGGFEGKYERSKWGNREIVGIQRGIGIGVVGVRGSIQSDGCCGSISSRGIFGCCWFSF